MNSVAGEKVSSIRDTDEDHGRGDTTAVVAQTQWMDLEQSRRENSGRTGYSRVKGRTRH